jgi:gamma-glutamyltranspeptidase / glutathione hydrolase
MKSVRSLRFTAGISRCALLAAAFSVGTTSAQWDSAASTCQSASKPPFCSGVRGDRAEGWLQQSRSEVMATHGMVVTSQPLAAQAGLRVLQQGGNAIDAAVAAAAVLGLVEPMMVGPAGDLFAVIYIAKERKVYVLNASGKAPSGATIERFAKLGYRWNPENWGPGSGMPFFGILPVTVPGAAWGWDEVLKRFGKLTFNEVLAPAIDYAENGFPVSERIASDWHLPNALPLEKCCKELDPDAVKIWYIDGKPPLPGQVFKNPGLARTYRLLQKGGRDAFYKGEIAEAIVAKSNALGGTMTLQDLADYRGEWVEPAATSYHGYELLELPPPAQAWAANEMLNILEACVPKWAPNHTLASLGPTQPRYWHFLVEAKKLAYNDLFAYNADPNVVAVPLAKLLSKAYAESLCGKVDPDKASAPGPKGNADGAGDTIVLSAADSEGNMVSWVNSNFAAFGSGVAVPGYGMILHNRGALFTLDPKSPNAIAPHKRPFNTLSAGLLMHDGRPTMTVTLMGGDMQAQGHAQMLVSILDLGANLQAAADLARFRHAQVSNVLNLESALFDRVGAQLHAMGHNVRSINGGDVGGVQTIMLGADGVYRAGSDFRKDGHAAGW